LKFWTRIATDNYIKWSLLFLFALIIFTLNLSEPGLYSTQEGNAAIITRNMIDSGNYLSVYIKDAHNTEKPVLSYWLCVLSCMFLGISEIGLRLPSATAAIIAVLLTAYLGRKIYGEKTGFLAGFILASMISFANLGRTARIDIILCVFFTLSMFFLYKGYIERKKATWYLYLFYVVLALSVLVKGPVGVVLAAIIILLYAIKEKNWRILWEIKPLSGLLIGIFLAAPWYLYESIRTHGEFAFDFLWNQNVNRFLGINTAYCDGQRKTFIFYVPNLFFGALPWSVFIPFAVYSLRKRFRQLGHSSYFLIFWVLAVFVFFSFSCIKRGDYILPLYPALAILIAKYLTYLNNAGKFFSKYWIMVWMGIFTVFVLFFILLYSGILRSLAVAALSDQVKFVGVGDAMNIIQLCDFIRPYFVVLSIFAALILAYIYICGKQFEKGKVLRGFYMIIAAFLIFHSVFVMWIQPYTDRFKSVKDFCILASKHVGKDEIVAYFPVWNLEAVFYLNRNYERAWRADDLMDFKTGKLKYKYYICPKSDYEIEDSRIKNKVEVICETIPGHHENLVLCKEKSI